MVIIDKKYKHKKYGVTTTDHIGDKEIFQIRSIFN